MKALLLVYEGCEPIEAITTADLLRRAKIELTLASLTGKIVEAGLGIKLIAEKSINELDLNEFDCLILPGGPGYECLLKSKWVQDAILDFNSKRKLIAAICAAPLALAKVGVLEDKLATCYPGLEKAIPKPRDKVVIQDGNIITSKGPGTAVDFALAIVKALKGEQTAENLRRKIAYGK